MKNKYSKIIALFLALSCLFSGTALSVNISADSNAELVTDELTPAEYAMVYNEANYERNYVDGEVIITLKDNVPAVESYETLFPEVDIASVKVISEKFLVLILETQTKQSVVDAINELKDNAYVKAAEPNYLYELASLTPIVPNDPYYTRESLPDQWHLSHIEADTAWNYTTGSSSIKVGVVDSGVANVADISDNLDMDSGINYVYEGLDPIGYRLHGTHIAGIIGAVGNNGIGVAGICWDVTIIPFKVLDDYGTYPNDFLAYEYLISSITDAENMGIDILNYSIDTSPGDYVMSDYTFSEAVQDFNGLVVFAAGNSGFVSSASPNYLSGPNEIVVGNSTQTDERHTTSNAGITSVDLFAPGDTILSTDEGGGYTTASGTSFSAPMVVGAAALIMSEYPNATAAEVKNAIIYSVNKTDNLTDYCASSGVLNVRRALEYLSDLHGNGDVTMDGTINNLDLIKLVRYIDFAASEDFSYDSTDSRALNEDQLMRADMNKDNVITEADTQALGQYLVQRSLNLEVQ